MALTPIENDAILELEQCVLNSNISKIECMKSYDLDNGARPSSKSRTYECKFMILEVVVNQGKDLGR